MQIKNPFKKIKEKRKNFMIEIKGRKINLLEAFDILKEIDRDYKCEGEIPYNLIRTVLWQKGITSSASDFYFIIDKLISYGFIKKQDFLNKEGNSWIIIKRK